VVVVFGPLEVVLDDEEVVAGSAVEVEAELDIEPLVDVIVRGIAEVVPMNVKAETTSKTAKIRGAVLEGFRRNI
jgi:hypothetical protein